MGPPLELGRRGARARAKLLYRPCLREQNLLHPRIRTKTPRFLTNLQVYSLSAAFFFLAREASCRAQVIFELLFVVTERTRLEFDMYGYLHNVNL